MRKPLILNGKLADRLHEVKRWHGTARLQDGETESDLEHSLDMLRIKDDLFARFDALAQEFSDKALSVMIEVHDTAEIFAGDAPQELTPEERAEHDQRERRYGSWLYASNPEIKELYQRSFDCAPDDKEALMTKLLDKMQAGETVIGRIAGKQDDTIVLENIETYTLVHAKKVYNKLRGLLHPKAQQELAVFFAEYQANAANTAQLLRDKINTIS